MSDATRTPPTLAEPRATPKFCGRMTQQRHLVLQGALALPLRGVLSAHLHLLGRRNTKPSGFTTSSGKRLLASTLRPM